ncbi:hypothetical protein SAMN05216409_11962 [Pseudomonas lutea]|uniref:Uncharacterized protein n=1 Tax=Pseudomonas lutea TaxID=243924 RepID=A0A9X8MHC2_9PSED|nr:hypothetical protein SAMN05216409_11962 [Pseudomonas lutea]
MQLNSRETNWIVITIFFVAFLSYVVVKYVADSLTYGDLRAGGYLVMGIVIALICLMVGLYNHFNDGLFRLGFMLPLVLVALVSGLWPAIQIWAAVPFYLPGMPLTNESVAWWATTHTKFTVLATVLFGGWGLAYWRAQRS